MSKRENTCFFVKIPDHVHKEESHLLKNKCMLREIFKIQQSVTSVYKRISLIPPKSAVPPKIPPHQNLADVCCISLMTIMCIVQSGGFLASTKSSLKNIYVFADAQTMQCIQTQRFFYRNSSRFSILIISVFRCGTPLRNTNHPDVV